MSRIAIPGLAAGQAAWDNATPDENPQWKLCEEIESDQSIYRATKRVVDTRHNNTRRIIRDVELLAEPVNGDETLMDLRVCLRPISTADNAKDAIGGALDDLELWIKKSREELAKT